MIQPGRACTELAKVMLGAVIVLSGIAASVAQEEPAPAGGLPGGMDVDADHVRQAEDGSFLFEGSVTISWGDTRFQADRITVRDQRYLEAEGHVLLAWKGSRVSGSRLTYDLDTERGEMEDAIGQLDADYYFWARRAEKIGDDRLRLESATVTTCTQPVAYWSFAVSSANVTLNRYARMWNVRLRTGKVPIFYLPYLIWPVKQDRAAGLLLPEFQTTENRGNVISQQLFVPIGRSADITLLGRYYSEAGFGGGGDARYIPNRNGEIAFSGFYIRDQVANNLERYRASYKQEQRFSNGFRMVADVNLVSDFNYFSDFETELSLVSSPTILTRLEFSRNGQWTSLNVRELRREQLFSGGDTLLQTTLPEIQWRGRSKRLGRTPLYLNFQSSLAPIRQRGVQQGFDIDTRYIRADLFPEISLPISSIPWLEVTPRVNYRVTHYTKQQRLVINDFGGTIGREVLDEPLTRTLFGAGLEFVGPKIVRIWETPGSKFSKAWKQTIEPNFIYGFQEDYDRLDEIIPFDSIDLFTGAGASIAYGVRSRLFAKRPRVTPPMPPGTGETILLPEGEVEELTPGEPPSGERVADTTRTESVEIASFELRQTHSFERDLSFADLDGDGVRESDSPFSPVTIIGRVNPSPLFSLDLRANYDILWERIRDVSLSGMSTSRYTRWRYSVIHREGLGIDGLGNPNPDDTQLNVTGGFRVLRDRLHIDFQAAIDANPEEGQARVPDRRWRLTYFTQCCTFYIEGLNRDFTSLEKRQDLHFRVDLRGLGKVLDQAF